MTYPSNSGGAEGEIRAFVDRILRLREEAKAINDDIREIYAEAKGNGYDKTALGKLVLYVEKRNKDASAVAESEAIFDLYLNAYDGTALATHAHAREKPKLDALLEGATRQEEIITGSVGREFPSEEYSETPAEGAPAGAADETHADAQSSGAATREDAEAAAPATKQWKHSDPAHPDCLDPAQCGGFSNLGLCQRCRDASHGEAA